jgi:cell division protein FtsA
MSSTVRQFGCPQRAPHLADSAVGPCSAAGGPAAPLMVLREAAVSARKLMMSRQITAADAPRVQSGNLVARVQGVVARQP